MSVEICRGVICDPPQQEDAWLVEIEVPEGPQQDGIELLPLPAAADFAILP